MFKGSNAKSPRKQSLGEPDKLRTMTEGAFDFTQVFLKNLDDPDHNSSVLVRIPHDTDDEDGNYVKSLNNSREIKSPKKSHIESIGSRWLQDPKTNDSKTKTKSQTIKSLFSIMGPKNNTPSVELDKCILEEKPLEIGLCTDRDSACSQSEYLDHMPLPDTILAITTPKNQAKSITSLKDQNGGPFSRIRNLYS